MSIYKKISERRMEIMGVAALMIFIYHFMYNEMWFSNIPLGFEAESLFKKLGDSGVDIFLFLSGMSLPNSIIHYNSDLDFYKKRMKRIVIPALLCSPVFAVYKKWSIIEYALSVSGINFVFKHIHSFLWYYVSIMIIYLAFPYYYRSFSKSKSKISHGLLSIGCVLLLSAIIRIFTTRIDLLIFVTKLPIFILGVLLNYYRGSKYLRYSIIKTFAAIVFVYVGIKIGYSMKSGELGTELGTYFYLSFPYLLIGLGLCYLIPMLFIIPYIDQLFIPFGKVSYEFYCSQIVYSEVMFYILPESIKSNIFVIFGIVTVITVFLYYSNRCICKLLSTN